MNGQTFGSIRAVYRGKRALVLGASGFIGRWVARLLTESGAEVILPVRDMELAERVFDEYEVSGEVIPFDLTQGSTADLIRRARPAVTFNLAGYGIDRNETDHKRAYEINSDFVQRLCSALGGPVDESWHGQTLVHAGTAMEYGAAKGDLNESTRPKPTTLYGRSKLEGTEKLVTFCNRSTLKAVVCRLFAVYGPGEHPNRLVPYMIDSSQTKGPLEFTKGIHKRDFCYVEDVAEGLLRIGVSNAPTGSVVNISSGNLTSIRTFIEITAKNLGIVGSRLDFGAIPTREEEMDHSAVSNSKLEALTNWVPDSDIGVGIRKTKAFLKKA